MKNTQIVLRCSDRDKEEIKRQAEEKQMTMSQYLLYLVHKNEKGAE